MCSVVQVAKLTRNQMQLVVLGIDMAPWPMGCMSWSVMGLLLREKGENKSSR